jgi:hypothetical protein
MHPLISGRPSLSIGVVYQVTVLGVITVRRSTHARRPSNPAVLTSTAPSKIISRVLILGAHVVTQKFQ